MEAVNQERLLTMGPDRPKPKGPALDPLRLPDDRLQVLIQTHRDMAGLEALRAERARRRVEGGGEGARAGERA